MFVKDLVAAMEELAPTRLAEAWDNVGLLVGDAASALSRVMLAIDYTPAVAAEARGAGCDGVIAYHPPIFEGLKRITAPSPVYDAARRGVAIYSPHTALDVAPGGTNDLLAEILGLVDVVPLRLADAKATGCKLVVFAPADAADRISAALFDAGAGRIGNYSSCSFRSPGTGTFFGQSGATHPATGQTGRLEQVSELRIEMVVPISKVGAVVSALRRSHPYEEPAFDLVPLAAAPEGRGQGRIGSLPTPTPRAELIERIKRGLALSQLLIAGPSDGNAVRGAVLAGAGREFVKDAIAQKVDLYLTGELPHHDALALAKAGVTVVCTLHSNSERASLRRLAERLSAKLPGVEFGLSKEDRDPFEIR